MEAPPHGGRIEAEGVGGRYPPSMDGNRHMTMTVHDGRSITAVNRNGVELKIDGKGEHGFTPLELFLAALGSCSALDFALLMDKQRESATPFAVDVDGLKEDLRMQFMRVTYRIVDELDARKTERARFRTAEDLCTVSRTIASGTRVEHVVEGTAETDVRG
jgi:putative redox protein